MIISDIKPHNLLVDPLRHVLKLCDFGSAKAFVKGEPNVAYICSRFYRAPELIFGCTDYTTAIDVWSAGCVFAELLLGSPIFPGSSAPDQLVEIIKIMGTPTEEQLLAMNPNYKEFKFPQIRAHAWGSIFKNASPETIDLAKNMLEYVPDKRLIAINVRFHHHIVSAVVTEAMEIRHVLIHILMNFATLKQLLVMVIYCLLSCSISRKKSSLWLHPRHCLSYSLA